MKRLTLIAAVLILATGCAPRFGFSTGYNATVPIPDPIEDPTPSVSHQGVFQAVGGGALDDTFHLLYDMEASFGASEMRFINAGSFLYSPAVSPIRIGLSLGMSQRIPYETCENYFGLALTLTPGWQFYSSLPEGSASLAIDFPLRLLYEPSQIPVGGPWEFIATETDSNLAFTIGIRFAWTTNRVPHEPIYVQGYYRSDGTYVRPHTRRLPRHY